jgi:tetratricopeptide (TPR) repeat protein
LIGEVVKENPRDSGALQLRAQMALAKGDARQAIADLRSLVKDHPDSAELVSLLARAHAMNNEPALARNVIDNAIARYPHDAALRVALADLLVFSHRDDEAARELDAALEIDPGNVRALQLRADFETSRKQWNAAEQTLGRLKAALPQQPIGYYRMGLVYQAQGQYDRARAEYETALAKAPLAAEPLAALVKLFMAQGKPDKAIARLNQALAVSPGSAIPHVLLGEVYRHENRYADAEAELRKALQIDRRAPRAYGTLATLYFSQGERNAALALLEEGVSANPQDALLPHALAEMYQRLGQMDKAIAEYERILARTPADDVAANNLASLLTDTKGDPESLQRALALAKRFDNASNPSLLDTLGWIYLKLGDTTRAVTLLQKAAEAAPLSPVYQYHLGMALYRQGDVKSAKAHLRRAVEAKTAFAGIDQARDVLARM